MEMSLFLGSSRCVRESGSPNSFFFSSFFFRQSYSKCNNNFGICYYHQGRMEKKKIFKRAQSPIGYVLNHFEKEVVLFLVFISFQDVCLPLCTLLEISL